MEAAAAARFTTELPNVLACWGRVLENGRVDQTKSFRATNNS